MRAIGRDEYKISFESDNGSKICFHTSDSSVDVVFLFAELPPFLCKENQEIVEKRASFTCSGKEKKIFIDQLIEATVGEAIMDIDISDIASAFDKIENGFFCSIKTSMNTCEKDIEKIKLTIGKCRIVLYRLEGNISFLEFNTITEKMIGDTNDDVLINWSDNSDYEESQVRISVWCEA